MRNILIVFFLFAVIISAFCQGDKIANYEIVKKTPLGYLPKDSKALPILVTTKKDKKSLATLENSIEYLNAKPKQRSFMLALGEIEYAYLDNNHKFVVPFGRYDFADVFGLGRKAIVANKGKYGIIDDLGKLVLPLEYDFIEQPSIWSNYANIFLATKKDTVTIFDENIKVIPTKSIASYWDRDGNLFVANKNNKIGLIDYNGKQTIPFIYDTLYKEHSVPRISGFVAKKDDFYGFVSSKNEVIQPFKYNYIYALKGGYAVYIDQNNKVGIYDEDGKIMIPFDYEAIYSSWYNNHHTKEFPTDIDIFIVEKDGKIGTIDNKNNVIIPIIYDGLSGWVEYGPEAHFVKNNNKYGLISHKGDIIIPIEYDYVGIPRDGVIRVIKNGKYGVVSWKNKEILPCIYDNIVLDIPWLGFGDDKPKIVALQKDVWKYFDLNGKLSQSNVSSKVINDNYDYIFKWGKPSNENYDFDLKQKGGIIRKR